MSKTNMDRRTLLKSFGLAGLVAGTLMDRRLAMAAGGAPPRRLIMFYTPGGFFTPCWQPDETWTGAFAGKPVDLPLSQMTFGKVRNGVRQNILDSLDDPKYAAIKNDVIVIDGVDTRAVERGDEHHNGIKAALRGRPIQTDDPGPFPNWSIDRVIGAHLFPNGDRPVHLKSANVNVGIGRYGYQSGIREAAEGGTSLEPTSVPQLWDAFFKDFVPGGMASNGPSPGLVDAYERRKLLAAHTRGELDGLKRMLGKDEQHALDRHLAAMNEITLQVENGYKAAAAGGAGSTNTAASVPARSGETFDPKRKLTEVVRETANILGHAMAFDRTRVAVLHTFGHNNNDSFWYPGSSGGYHNGVCHGGDISTRAGTIVSNAALSAGKTLIRMYLDILLTLKSIPEGDGTMLDSTTVATYSDTSDGGHRFRVPVLLMMGGGGGLAASGARHWKTGRYVKFLDRGQNDYLISLAHGMGVTEYKTSSGDRKPLVQIGSAKYNKGPLPGLTG